MKRFLLSLLFILAFTQLNFAQQNIKGKIVDAISRQPLETVSIAVAVNSSVNTLSDQYGNFTLHTDKGGASLLIS